MRVSIIGTGYVGLVTGTVLSDIGHSVTCLDINEEKIALLQQGKSPIYEPGLDELLEKNIQEHRLAFTTNVTQAFKDAQFIFIAVGTPQGDDGSANLSFIEQAAKDIAMNVTDDCIVIVKSTVPVGTNDRVEQILRENGLPHIQFNVVSNPEFLREGHAIRDTFYGDRIVIGAELDEVSEEVAVLFQPLNIPIVKTNRRSAEMIKYAANAFLAVKISYINQISNLCEKVGADIHSVADGIGMDSRIGRAFLNAGLGYGGSCFPKDTEALSFLAREHDVSMSIVESAIDANHKQRQIFIQKVLHHFDGNVQGKRIAVLGLAFKPNTDDMRDAPSIDIIRTLVHYGAEVTVFDPVVKVTSMLENISITYASSLEQCVEQAEAALLVTEWPEFVHADWSELTSRMKHSTIFDGRYVLHNSQKNIEPKIITHIN
ncbi:UDP-glucose dehydrogenase family protein [Paenibacillus endoradicis]|uniref:UDP-glucose dehydrogenase family protein n=1 Tax=Paenibacillus endoradicis TaxID=2972487 RepID=UPI0021595D2B|nr:UDP-glucose/GDP-mannose dehydrogenase family protein [Paenibacillus endoradicis]MCR8660516.1 UDP-glucose/GDP-mannose dehydrogenase family protein [Paenibacillus endoradicis]